MKATIRLSQDDICKLIANSFDIDSKDVSISVSNDPDRRTTTVCATVEMPLHIVPGPQHLQQQGKPNDTTKSAAAE